MWESKLKLEAGDKVVPVGSTVEGFMGETDVSTYSIVKADGTLAGSVKVRDHTAVKGFKRTITVTQTDVNGVEVMSAVLPPQ